MLSGTPPVVALAALDHALDRFDGVDLAALRARSLELTDRFIAGADSLGLEVVAPREHDLRGSQVSVRHQHAWEVTQALLEVGVIGDHRPPDLIRLGFPPLHVSDDDVDEALARLAEVLRTESWTRWLDADRPTVT
jgi:kynureninase